MAIARTTGILGIGQDETNFGSSGGSTSGSAIANNAICTGVEVDVLGDNLSCGDVEVYLSLTSTVTAGSVDVTVNRRRLTGQDYEALTVTRSYAPINGAQLLYLGTFRAVRFMQAKIKNNGTGANASFSLLYCLTKLS